MTKEQLEELIKKNGTVYFGTYNEDDIFTLVEIKLAHCYILDNELHDEQEHCYYDFVDLFETKEQAEWHCKMDAERTERFEPPMWEKLYLDEGYCFKTIIDYKVLHFIVSQYTIEVKFEEDNDCLFLQKTTKENYEKACEIVRDLFRGKS